MCPSLPRLRHESGLLSGAKAGEESTGLVAGTSARPREGDERGVHSPAEGAAALVKFQGGVAAEAVTRGEKDGGVAGEECQVQQQHHTVHTPLLNTT